MGRRIDSRGQRLRLRQPLLLTPAAGLAIVPYSAWLLEGLQPLNYGLALAPLALLALGVAVLLGTLERHAGRRCRLPLVRPAPLAASVVDGLLRRWALPFDLLAISPSGWERCCLSAKILARR
jgi:hypothetical protein